MPANNLAIISVNLWQILISLCNLLIIFLILKKFLFKPVRNIIATRKAQIDADYAKADEAAKKAQASQEQWETTLATANDKANEILSTARTNAQRRGDAMMGLAKEKAELIVRRAQEDAALEQRKAKEQIKKDLADVSVLLTEKMLDREINADDHRELIDSFIETIGDDHDANS